MCLLFSFPKPIERRRPADKYNSRNKYTAETGIMEGGSTMRIGGTESGQNTDTHYVTKSVHSHPRENTQGAMGAMSSSGKTDSLELTQATKEVVQEGTQGLLQQVLTGTKSLWGSIWGDGNGASAQATGAAGGNNAEQAAAQGLTQSVATGQNSHVTTNAPLAGAANVSASERLQPGGTQEAGLGHRIKGIAGQLANRLKERLFHSHTDSSFSMSKERQRQEEMKRQAKRKRDEVLLRQQTGEDNFLLDSYDRKGEYRKLTTKE